MSRIAAVLLLVSSLTVSCSGDKGEDKGKSTFEKVLEAPGKFSEKVRKADSTISKAGETVGKVAGKIEEYAPDSLKRNR